MPFPVGQSDGVAGPGGDGIDGFISPKDSYEDSDIGKGLWENGLLKRVERELHTGHGKTVGGVADPGEWVVIGDSGDEGGGAGAHFRGWHNRPDGLTGAAPGRRRLLRVSPVRRLPEVFGRVGRAERLAGLQPVRGWLVLGDRSERGRR